MRILILQLNDFPASAHWTFSSNEFQSRLWFSAQKMRKLSLSLQVLMFWKQRTICPLFDMDLLWLKPQRYSHKNIMEVLWPPIIKMHIFWQQSPTYSQKEILPTRTTVITWKCPCLLRYSETFVSFSFHKHLIQFSKSLCPYLILNGVFKLPNCCVSTSSSLIF